MSNVIAETELSVTGNCSSNCEELFRLKPQKAARLEVSELEFRDLREAVRKVVPAWLLRHHSATSIATQTFVDLAADPLQFPEFQAALQESDKEAMLWIWKKSVFRVRDRLKQRIKRRRDQTGLCDLLQNADGGDLTPEWEAVLNELLDEIENHITNSSTQSSDLMRRTAFVFRKLYVPCLVDLRNTGPSRRSIATLAGCSDEMAERIQARIKRAIRDVCDNQ